ncbi:MAG: 30S ribosomal protein S20 [Candidatus Moraniibacteriota bacterium]|jgi:small subunit ribosomal protein S20|nr:MAG: 30S ribosomal protein S20 [Candidatus Moranbacteria bacterium]
MANKKHSEKAARQAAKHQEVNRVYRSGARTAVRKARTAITTGGDEATAAVMEAISVLDRAATKGVIHKNNAARRKSRLMKALNAK